MIGKRRRSLLSVIEIYNIDHMPLYHSPASVNRRHCS